MKKNVHPKYHSDAKIICSCGNIIKVGSTVPEMKIEICSACHPIYTGKQKVLDATGRVERFKKLAQKAVEKKSKAPEKKVRVRKAKAETKKVVSKKKIQTKAKTKKKK